MIKILAAVSIGLGAFITLANWYAIYSAHRSGRSESPAPLLGGLLLVVGLLGFPETRPYAWLGVIADPGLFLPILAIPALIWDLWSTSKINLVHRFVSNSGGRHDDIRLLKRGKFTIESKHDPPVPCNEHGALALSHGFVGVWREDPSGFVLERYRDNRILRIVQADGVYRTREENYPQNEVFPADRLDSLELKKVE